MADVWVPNVGWTSPGSEYYPKPKQAAPIPQYEPVTRGGNTYLVEKGTVKQKEESKQEAPTTESAKPKHAVPTPQYYNDAAGKPLTGMPTFKGQPVYNPIAELISESAKKQVATRIDPIRYTPASTVSQGTMTTQSSMLLMPETKQEKEFKKIEASGRKQSEFVEGAVVGAGIGLAASASPFIAGGIGVYSAYELGKGFSEKGIVPTLKEMTSPAGLGMLAGGAVGGIAGSKLGLKIGPQAILPKPVINIKSTAFIEKGDSFKTPKTIIEKGDIKIEVPEQTLQKYPVRGESLSFEKEGLLFTKTTSEKSVFSGSIIPLEKTFYSDITTAGESTITKKFLGLEYSKKIISTQPEKVSGVGLGMKPVEGMFQLVDIRPKESFISGYIEEPLQTAPAQLSQFKSKVGEKVIEGTGFSFKSPFESSFELKETSFERILSGDISRVKTERVQEFETTRQYKKNIFTGAAQTGGRLFDVKSEVNSLVFESTKEVKQKGGIDREGRGLAILEMQPPKLEYFSGDLGISTIKMPIESRGFTVVGIAPTIAVSIFPEVKTEVSSKVSFPVISPKIDNRLSVGVGVKEKQIPKEKQDVTPIQIEFTQQKQRQVPSQKPFQDIMPVQSPVQMPDIMQGLRSSQEQIPEQKPLIETMPELMPPQLQNPFFVKPKLKPKQEFILPPFVGYISGRGSVFSKKRRGGRKRGFRFAPTLGGLAIGRVGRLPKGRRYTGFEVRLPTMKAPPL